MKGRVGFFDLADRYEQLGESADRPLPCTFSIIHYLVMWGEPVPSLNIVRCEADGSMM